MQIETTRVENGYYTTIYKRSLFCEDVENNKGKGLLVYWLITGCIMIAIMVVIGGITRLTHSGLSITEWKPITGALPPLNEADWETEFEKYRQIPEFSVKHSHMKIEDFKFIYFWEFVHRQWGRLMGIVFIIPFVLFLWKGVLRGKLLKKTVIILFGGAGVASLGWFMVASGLKDMPDVSHYRLAIHLTAAFSLFLYILYTALDLLYPHRLKLHENLKPFKNLLTAIIAVTFVQVIYGAFVAGLRAGTIHTTFPLMTGQFIPHDFMLLHGNILDFLEHKTTVQFTHRILAFSLLGLVISLLIKGFKMKLTRRLRTSLYFIAMAFAIQFTLGAFTVIYAVPVSLGVLHQLGALVFLTSLFYAFHALHRDEVPVEITESRVEQEVAA